MHSLSDQLEPPPQASKKRADGDTEFCIGLCSEYGWHTSAFMEGRRFLVKSKVPKVIGACRPLLVSVLSSN